MLGFIRVPGEIFLVEIRDGNVRLARGQISPGLFADLRGVAESFPNARGRLLVSHDGSRPRLEVTSLAEDAERSVRDAIDRHSNRLTIGATLHAETTGAGGGAIAVVALASVMTLGASALIAFGPMCSRRADRVSEDDARSIGREVAGEQPDVERRARAFEPFVERLRRTGVLPPARGPEDAMYIASGPEISIMMGPRIVTFAVESDGPQWSPGKARELEDQLRALGFADASASCDASAGCVVSAGARRTTLVRANESLHAVASTDCLASRIAIRLGTFLRELEANNPSGRQVILISGTWGFEGAPFFGPGDGHTVVYAFLTDAELRALAEWQSAFDDAPMRPFGDPPPFEARLEPRCRTDAGAP